MKYTLILPQTRSIRYSHSVSGMAFASLTKGTDNGGDELWTCSRDGEFLNAKKGDQWLHITLPVDGWVAVIHAGVVQCELVESTNSETPLYTIEFYEDGRLFINGTLHA
jgi:hypothetical protein